MDIEKELELLACKNTVQGCAAMERMRTESAKSPAVYAYMDTFFELLENKNSYVRNRAAALIAANAVWDIENKIDDSLDRFLAHINDEKPITARQCITAAIRVAEVKRNLCGRILAALKSVDTKGYADSMRSLVEKDIAYATACIEKIL